MKRTIAAIALASTALLLAGCSAGEADDVAAPSSTPGAATTTAPHTTEPTAEPASIYEVTEAGLTTAVNAPITESADKMAQACTEAKAMMSAMGTSDVEVVLAMIQATAADSTDGVTVNTEGDPWGDGTPGEQAAIIASVHAAANGEC
ncbi:lipoprotein LpqV [Rhodococcus marinonascens]|uniref:lipoprotein LpqV n=1 Tax=Rhodococcus marinonascens TaxID=38311 RepID=UPI00093355D3|nr:lipoprotein LpqV [Rhodococcus marinonascens]